MTHLGLTQAAEYKLHALFAANKHFQHPDGTGKPMDLDGTVEHIKRYMQWQKIETLEAAINELYDVKLREREIAE